MGEILIFFFSEIDTNHIHIISYKKKVCNVKDTATTSHNTLCELFIFFVHKIVSRAKRNKFYIIIKMDFE